jgi:serine/threonine protein kinase
VGRTVRCQQCQTSFLALVIGRYQIWEKLGSGAFGTVYRAFDPHLEREVALKVLRPEALDSPQAVERFQREAVVAAGLRHPHIVTVFDFGEHDHQHFLVSDFISGSSLSSAIPPRGMEPRRAAGLTVQLALALDHAHQHGVLHRDVKPANILLDNQDNLYLMDFGLAGWTEPSSVRLTRSGMLVGTPAFMAPEQASGAVEQVGPAADLYAAGVVLYEMLTGQPPFAGRIEAVIYHVIHSPPPPPSQYRPGLSPQLEAICLKALAKNPKQRHANGQEMAEALRGWLATQEPTPPATENRVTPPRPQAPPTMPRAVPPPLPPARPRETVVNAQSEQESAADLPLPTPVAAPVVWWKNKAVPLSAGLMLALLALVVLVMVLPSRPNRPNQGTLQPPELTTVTPEEESLSRARQETENAQAKLKEQQAAAERASRFSQLLAEARMLLEKGSLVEARRKLDEAKQLDAKAKDLQKTLEQVEQAERGKEVKDACDKAIQSGNTALAARQFDRAIEHYAAALHVLASAGGRLPGELVEPWRRAAQTGKAAAEKQRDTARTHPEPSFTLKGQPAVWSVAISADGKRIVSGDDNNVVMVWDADTRKLVYSREGHAHFPESVAISADGKSIVSGDQRFVIRGWDAFTGNPTYSFPGHTDWIYSLAISADGKRIASGSCDNTVRVRSTTGQKPRTFRGHGEGVSTVAMRADGKWIVSGGLDATVRLWDADTGVIIHTLKLHMQTINSVAISADGQRIVSGSSDTTVIVWDAGTGQPIRTFREHSKGVYKVVISADGKRIVSRSAERTLVWNADTGLVTHTLKGDTDVHVRGAAISADGKRIVTGGEDGIIKVWDIDR